MGKTYRGAQRDWHRGKKNFKKNNNKKQPYIPPRDWDAMGDDVTKFSYPEPEPRWDDMAS